MNHKRPYLRRSVLQAEIDLCQSKGICVYELSSEFFKSRLKGHWPNKLIHRAAGLYRSRSDPNCGPMATGFEDAYNIEDRSIVIKKNLPNYDKFTTLLHEKGHDVCHESQCKCIHKPVLSEIHAWRYEFSILLQRKLWNILKAEIEGFRRNNPYDIDAIHYKAIQAIKKSALWRRCVHTACQQR